MHIKGGVNFICTYDGGKEANADGELTEGKTYTGMQVNENIYIVNNHEKVVEYCWDCFEPVEE